MINATVEVLMKDGQVETLSECDVKNIVSVMIGNMLKVIENDPRRDEYIALFQRVSAEVEEFIIRVHP